jgi:hypothetical protein
VKQQLLSPLQSPDILGLGFKEHETAVLFNAVYKM